MFLNSIAKIWKGEINSVSSIAQNFLKLQPVAIGAICERITNAKSRFKKQQKISAKPSKRTLDKGSFLMMNNSILPSSLLSTSDAIMLQRG